MAEANTGVDFEMMRETKDISSRAWLNRYCKDASTGVGIQFSDVGHVVLLRDRVRSQAKNSSRAQIWPCSCNK
jgi:hypothetical protein